MSKVKKMVNGINQIIPLNTHIVAQHEEGGRSFRRVVLAMGLVVYADGTTGIELMELSRDGKVEPLADTVKKIELYHSAMEDLAEEEFEVIE